MKTHTTKSGEKILISDMDMRHLQNTIAMKQRQAKRGVTVQVGNHDPFGNDHYYDERTVYGAEAERYLKLDDYRAEMEKRVGPCQHKAAQQTDSGQWLCTGGCGQLIDIGDCG